MTRHVVTGHHNGTTFPYLVATHPRQYGTLVRDLLRSPFPDSPQVHASTFFYVTDHRVWNGQWPARWLRVGLHHEFGGALFVDETEPDSHDWSWAALAAEPLANPPTVYFDQDGDVAFPPRAVMPIDQLHDVVLEWISAGERPRSVDWVAINALVWRLDRNGRAVVPPPRGESA